MAWIRLRVWNNALDLIPAPFASEGGFEIGEADFEAILQAASADPSNRDALRRVALELRPGTRVDSSDSISDDDVVAALVSARAMGRLQGRWVQPAATSTSQAPDETVVDLAELAEGGSTEEDEGLTFLEVQVLYEDGRPYKDCEIAIDIPGEDRRDEALDGEAKLRLDDVPGAHTCVVTFPQNLPMPDPQDDPLTPPDPDGEVVTVTRREPGLVRLSSGKTHRIVIRRARVHMLQMEDLHFQVGRAMLLADGEPPPDDESNNDEGNNESTQGVTSLSVAAAVLKYAKDNPEQQLLVAGHTDTTGSETFNADLSEARATNVQLFLAGDRDGWAGHCADNAADEDAQRALRWASRHFGWPCDPGPIDNAFGKKSKSALAAFRTRFQAHTGESAGEGDAPTTDDYAAIFTLYDEILGSLLSDDAGASNNEGAGNNADLDAWREGLTFVDPSTLACGESWPEDAVGIDNYPSAQNRRVDLLFFDEEEVPPDLGQLDPPGKSIYGDPMYVLEPIDVDPHDRPNRRVCFEIAVALDDPESEPDDAALHLTAEGYDLRASVSDASALGGGLLAFRFPGVHEGASYSLHYEAAGIDPAPLFEDLSLDAFLQKIGDPEAEVDPLPIAPIPAYEAEEDAPASTSHGPMHPEMSLAQLDTGDLRGAFS